MLRVPEKIISYFSAFLSKRNIPITYHNYYKKWLRYYLDFCHKYRFDFLDPESLPHFLDKLKEKRQTGTQQKQAHESIRLFYALAGQQIEIKGTLEKITQRYQNVEEKGAYFKPAIHDSGPVGDKYNRKKSVNKEQNNQSWQHIQEIQNDGLRQHQ